jgi:predicted O-methyltransferase YrrM
LPVFNHDYTSHFAEQWTSVLGQYTDVPNVRGMEIGCFEGRSTRWFVENILTGENSKLICVDPWPQPNFLDNLTDIADKIRYFKVPSMKLLRNGTFELETLDFLYIDGDHSAPAVLEDGVLGFGLLKPGGILIFDDYRFVRKDRPNRACMLPKLAIDSFMAVYEDKISVILCDYQVVLKKL